MTSNNFGPSRLFLHPLRAPTDPDFAVGSQLANFSEQLSPVDISQTIQLAQKACIPTQSIGMDKKACHLGSQMIESLIHGEFYPDNNSFVESTMWIYFEQPTRDYPPTLYSVDMGDT